MKKAIVILFFFIQVSIVSFSQNNILPHYTEKVLVTEVFPNGVSNQAIDIVFGNNVFWGNIEVEITGSWWYQNSVGKLLKHYSVGMTYGGIFYTNESRVAEASGTVPYNVSLGELSWDPVSSRYRIPISHIVSTQNSYTVKVRLFSHGGYSEIVNNSLSVSGLYHLQALPQNAVHFTGTVGIGTAKPGLLPNATPSGSNALLEVKGNIRINTLSTTASGEIGNLQFFKAHTHDINTVYSSAEIRAFTTSGYDGGLRFYTSQHIGNGNYDLRSAMTINHLGNIGVGADASSDKFSVNGSIRAKKLTVSQTGWPDYVFESSYPLRTLPEVEKFIIQYKRLPDIPSAKEVEEKGISVGDNQALLLKKMEEMTLYMISMNKEIIQLKEDNKQLKKALKKYEK
jgi:hypothetical protein